MRDQEKLRLCFNKWITEWHQVNLFRAGVTPLEAFTAGWDACQSQNAARPQGDKTETVKQCDKCGKQMDYISLCHTCAKNVVFTGTVVAAESDPDGDSSAG